MATDATGTPTSPDAIPTYLTSADAPSGKGFNAAMAAIQVALSSRIPKTLTTTTGDLIYASGANTPARLGIGSTGNVLTVSGGLPTWAAASVGSMSLIQDILLGSPSAALDFSSIPATFKHLLIEWAAVDTAGAGTQLGLGMQFNADTGSNYALQDLTGSGASPASFGSTGASSLRAAIYAGSGGVSSGQIWIPNYSQAVLFKSFHGTSYCSAGGLRVDLVGGNWTGTAIINEVKLLSGSTSFAVGSRATLYGVG